MDMRRYELSDAELGKAGTEVPAFMLASQRRWLPCRLFATGHRDLIAALAAVAQLAATQGTSLHISSHQPGWPRTQCETRTEARR